jgi:flagellar P-ring protein precursor FlgI
MLRFIKSATVVLLVMGLLLSGRAAEAIRLKDLTSLGGVRDNQLVGYGLIVGLNGTGDKSGSQFTIQSLVSMLERQGLTVDPKLIKVKNVAAVIVTAVLPPFARNGSRVDTLISSIGDASSLQGGTLLLTPLRAPDGKVYAVAQGPVSVGGAFSASGSSGSSVSKNHPTVGKISSGALIEREIAMDFSKKSELVWSLNNPDFVTATRVVETINRHLGVETARAQDAGTIRVMVPEKYQGRVVELVANIESLEVTPDVGARVVLDERSGTVVIGENVRISTVAISHGNLSLIIKERPKVSQPSPFSSTGDTVVVPRSEVTVKEEKAKLIVLKSGANINDVARALNAIGVTPRDLIAIFQAIKAAGALQATLEII